MAIPIKPTRGAAESGSASVAGHGITALLSPALVEPAHGVLTAAVLPSENVRVTPERNSHGDVGTDEAVLLRLRVTELENENARMRELLGLDRPDRAQSIGTWSPRLIHLNDARRMDYNYSP